jgi:hypothetical protein
VFPHETFVDTALCKIRNDSQYYFDDIFKNLKDLVDPTKFLFKMLFIHLLVLELIEDILLIEPTFPIQLRV